MNARVHVPDAGNDPAGLIADTDAQINVPPTGPGRLWKVVAMALRCPACASTHHKAETGKRLGAEGLMEHYRRCRDCGIRFRVIFE